MVPATRLNDPNALFIPLVSDYGFKGVFGNEKNTRFLRKVLQALIQSEVPIREVRFDKNTFDAIVKDSRGVSTIWPALMRQGITLSSRCRSRTRLTSSNG